MKIFVAFTLMALAINSYSQEDTFCPAYIYNGFIENGTNQSHEIKVNFTILSDSILIGSYQNYSSNTASKLMGHLNDDNSFSMLEKDDNENITGLFKGKLSADNTTATGQWSSPINDHVFNFKFITSPEIRFELINKKNKLHYQHGDIRQAIKESSKVKSIEVERHGYKVLPRKLSRLSSIESIYLDGNKFEMFPLVLFKLSTLDEISLGGNKIKYLSSSIGKLENLKLLKLNNNKLKYIPKEISNLANLVYLDLSYNNLSTLPAEIKNLRNLQELHLQGNPLLPGELEKITKLLPRCIVTF